MLLADYRLDELRFAYCSHVYLHWCTYRRRPCPPLARLDRPTLQARVDRMALSVLDCQGGPTDLRVLVSLRPSEAVATAASKLKGQTSKWLREALGLVQPADLLARGYFACTTGKSTRPQVEAYLDRQGEHHGYAQRTVPPVYVATYTPPRDEARLQAHHACTVLRFHLVFATWRRQGVFGPTEAQAVAACWRGLEDAERFALLKVSFVPDHVHVAIRLHPAVVPDRLALVLLNAAQHCLVEQFPEALVQARVERLWQPSAYLGSFGDLATPALQQYLRNWAACQEQESQVEHEA
jgi:REP element-mobilizing transposase RayT